MKIFNRKKQNLGFLTVEVIVAVAIITVSVLAALTVTEKALKVSRQSLHSAEAAFLLEEGAEAVRILRDNGWSNISSLSDSTTYYLVFSGGTWALSSTPSQIGIFTRTISVDSVSRDAITGDIDPSGDDDPGTKLITMQVSWYEGLSLVSKTLQFYIIDIFS